MGDETFSDLESEKSVSVEDSEWEGKQKRQRRWLTPLLLGTGLGIALALGGIKFLSQHPAAQKTATSNQGVQKVTPSMTVTVATVESKNIGRTLSTTGSVAARDLTPVLPQANGLLVKQVLVDVGNNVKAGQVMAVLDNSLLQDQIRQAKADVESKQADAESKRADLLSKQAAIESSKAAVAANQAIVQQRQADLAQAKAKLVDAQRTFRRNQELFGQGAISRQVFDTAETNFATAREAVRLGEANIRSAEANISSAKANVSSAEADVRTAQANINSAEASVKSNQSKVQQFKTQIGQTLVHAPVSGIVAEKLIRVGDVTGVPPQTLVNTVVGGSQKLFSIIQDGKLELLAQVPEVQLAQIKIGSSVDVTSDSDNRIRLQGKVREIEPVVNQQRREATVKIDLPTTTILRPGMFARAAIATSFLTGVAVPQKAVQTQSEGETVVFILSGEDNVSQDSTKVSKVKAQRVEVGQILNGNKVEIKHGLRAGDRIVIDGAGYIKDGDTVRIASSQ